MLSDTRAQHKISCELCPAQSNSVRCQNWQNQTLWYLTHTHNSVCVKYLVRIHFLYHEKPIQLDTPVDWYTFTFNCFVTCVHALWIDWQMFNFDSLSFRHVHSWLTCMDAHPRVGWLTHESSVPITDLGRQDLPVCVWLHKHTHTMI